MRWRPTGQLRTRSTYVNFTSSQFLASTLQMSSNLVLQSTYCRNKHRALAVRSRAGWGRISETYGEDPLHIQTIGVTALQGLQNPLPVPGGHPDDAFFATRQVTRHYIEYHGASPDIQDMQRGQQYTFVATNRSLADSYFPTYGAFQRPELGRADGIMCAMSELNGVPSCASPLLLDTMLRQKWRSDAIVQSDCCDSVRTMVNEVSPATGRPVANLTESLGLAINSGLGAYFGYYVGPFKDAMFDLLSPQPKYANGESVSAAKLAEVAQRILLSHFRLGFYDAHADDYPFHNNSINWNLLDSPAHRALARETAAKSTVLLKNTAATLPLPASGGPKKIAVIGPFAACASTNPNPAYLNSKTEGKNAGMCYLHSYNGQPSNITSIFGGIWQQGSAMGANVVYSLGSNETCPHGGGAVGTVDCVSDASSKFYSAAAASAIVDAKAAASAADVTILAVGLGVLMEAEGRDRVNMTLPSVQAALLDAVSAVAQKLIIVIVSAGGVDLDESKAAAVLWQPYGGEEAGSGLADVIWGKTNPSARLPVTVYKQAWADAMNCNNYTEAPGSARKYLSDCSTSILQVIASLHPVHA